MLKKNSFIKNMSFAFLANLVSLLVSTVLILLVPKFVGVKSYGYFQLYLFYTTYVSYMSLGITDGIYLRLGGEDYNQVEKSILTSQYWFLVLFNIIVNSIVFITFFYLSTDSNKIFVMLATCIVGILVVPRSLITFVLQATNRIKEFSTIILIEKTVFFFLTILILINFTNTQFEYIILADILAKILSVLYSIYLCPDIIFGKLSNLTYTYNELRLNFKIGINLFISNLSSMLIIGVVRFFIENTWSIEIFGKVSLSLSMSNMVLVFISAISIVLFPTLKNIDYESKKKYYSVIRNMIMPILLLGMLLYFPLVIFFHNYLPIYDESFKYMGLLFPMVIFEGKTLVLVNTYLKSLREEKTMLKVNLFVVLLSILFSYIISNFIGNLHLMIILIVLLVILRNLMLEFYLAKLLDIKVIKDIILEVILSFSFIFNSIYLNPRNACLVYFLMYFVYILIKNKEIQYSIFLLKNFRTKE